MGRRLGQHFLTDPAILDRIVDALGPELHDVVLEIGPGRGSLTRRLAPRVARVVAVERDADLVRQLRETGNGKREPDVGLPANVELLEADALKTDWALAVAGQSTLAGPPFPFPFKVVGNIPYYITSPLIEKALSPPFPAVVVFLVQREVADRLRAEPGSRAYGALSVGVQCAASVERICLVRAGSFQPPPKVDSAVVRLRPRVEPLVGVEERASFRAFVVGLFGQRRKQLSRALRAVTGQDKDAVGRLLEGVGLAPDIRAEVLRPSEFVALFRALNR